MGQQCLHTKSAMIAVLLEFAYSPWLCVAEVSRMTMTEERATISSHRFHVVWYSSPCLSIYDSTSPFALKQQIHFISLAREMV